MLDLTTLDTTTAADAGSILEVLHPTTGAVLPIKITLAGEDSERFRNADRAARNRRFTRQQTGRPAKVSAEELENDSLETLVACTIGWSGVSLGGGEELEFSPENARKVYTRIPWLREQAQAFIFDRANFLKASPKP